MFSAGRLGFSRVTDPVLQMSLSWCESETDDRTQTELKPIHFTDFQSASMRASHFLLDIHPANESVGVFDGSITESNGLQAESYD